MPEVLPQAASNGVLKNDNAASFSKPVRKICCIGAGYVGGPTCSVIANKNPEVEVTIVDLSEQRIAAWHSDDLPIHEPGLKELVEVARDGSPTHAANLRFSTNVNEAIAAADLIFVAVNTPTKTTGYGANQALDMSYFEGAIKMIARAAVHDTIIVEKSTVPCGTANFAKEILANTARPGIRFEILSNPEFLAEGTAVFNLLHPDRILIGSETTEAGLAAMQALTEVYAAWIPRDRIIAMNTRSAELAKLAANALLAQRISSINALSALCESIGADIDEVAFACGLDARIGPRMLKASVGYGGSCLKKDVLNLAHFSETLRLPNVAAYWKSVDDINEQQKDRFAQRIIMSLHNTLTRKKIAVLGFAFKKDTGDIRLSAAIHVVVRLIEEKADVYVYDPQVKEEDLWRSLEEECGKPRATFHEYVHISSDVYSACDKAHVAVIVTEWDEFSNKSPKRLVPLVVPPEMPTISDFPDIMRRRESSQHTPTVPKASSNAVVAAATPKSAKKMDWAHVAKIMEHPKFVFDGRNIVDQEKLAELGFHVECIGKAAVGPKRDATPVAL